MGLVELNRVSVRLPLVTLPSSTRYFPRREAARATWRGDLSAEITGSQSTSTPHQSPVTLPSISLPCAPIILLTVLAPELSRSALSSPIPLSVRYCLPLLLPYCSRSQFTPHLSPPPPPRSRLSGGFRLQRRLNESYSFFVLFSFCNDSALRLPASGVARSRRRMEDLVRAVLAVTCAADALATLLVAYIVKTQLLTQGSMWLLQLEETEKKRDDWGKGGSWCEAADAEGDDEGDDDDEDEDGGYGEGEEDLSSEGGEEYGSNNNSNKKSDSKKGSWGGGAEENGEEEENEDGENPDEDGDNDDDDDDDDSDEEDGEEEEEEEEVVEEDEDEDEEALQPPKKRKK
ncbi:hypothetical protein SAY86_025861 [Trapa natans]|uniref:Uncharacterized protein n=1 Tax=Trapa natans TaxID=22666 RepID=A0AAN7KD75_TRANT|nr:hypothetical protein SAY86_025861 [Trapa natans]